MAKPNPERKPDADARPSRSRWWRVWRWQLHWQILLGLGIGALFGLAMGLLGMWTASETQSAEEIVTDGYIFQVAKLLGDLFLNGLKMIVIPLVISSIVLAIAGLGTREGFGMMGLKTMAYYLCTSTVAILIGLALVNLVAPGKTRSGEPLLDSESAAQLSQNFGEESEQVVATRAASEQTDLLGVFRRMIPENPVGAAVEGNLLGLIVIALLVGFFLARLSTELQETMTRFFNGVHDITMGITNLVLRFAPIGVGMLLATTVAENFARLAAENRFGEFVSSVVWFAATAFVALCIHMFVVMPLILALVARVNPLKHYRAMGPALLTAFSTSSSNATLPLTMECVEHRGGVSNKTTSFVLPLGATINMDGTALYECVAAIFVVQAFGIDLSFSQQFFIVVVALLTSIGVAGVPSASLVAIIIILDSLTNQLRTQGIEIDFATGLPILLVFDRLLDMCRTVVNIFSDSCGAVVVARSEGETDLYPGM